MADPHEALRQRAKELREALSRGGTASDFAERVADRRARLRARAPAIRGRADAQTVAQARERLRAQAQRRKTT